MAKTFHPMTEQFVVERTYAIGTIAMGYGNTREEAELDSDRFGGSEFAETAGPTTKLEVFTKTGKLVRQGKGMMEVYAQI